MRSRADWVVVIGCILMGMTGIGLFGLVAIVDLFDGEPIPEAVTYDATIEERFRELEQRVDTMEGQVEPAKRPALAGSEESALAAVYVNMAARYFATMATLGANNLTPEEAAQIVVVAVSADTQLSEVWGMVITNQASPRLFEDLLWGKLLVLLTGGLAPALDG